MANTRHIFSKSVVVISLLFMTWFCYRCLVITQDSHVSTADMIGAAAIFWGGELFVLAGKQVLDKRNNEKEKNIELEE